MSKIFSLDLMKPEDNGIIVLRKVQTEYPPDAVSHSKRTQSSRTDMPTGHSGIYYAEIKLAATFNKNKQQQMPKVMLNYRLMDTTWKSFEEAIRRGRNRSIKTLIVTDDGYVDHYY